MMNIGIILPAEESNKKRRALKGLLHLFSFFTGKAFPIETYRIDITEGLSLIACAISLMDNPVLTQEGLKKRYKARIDKVLEEERAWPVLEHPMVRGIYQPYEYRFEEANREVVLNRFFEVLTLLHGVGDLSTREITVTGGSLHLEYAISKLITKVKSLNLLIPEDGCEPIEAEQAFIETGIPIHITTDCDVLKRTRVWIRFPNDHQSFDLLPRNFEGIIIDLGEMKIIDTKNRKIFSITVEFSDRIKRKIGQRIIDAWEKGVLEGVILTVCSNAWDIDVTETSTRLGMRISFNS